jgi:hypothetical protein
LQLPVRHPQGGLDGPGLVASGELDRQVLGGNQEVLGLKRPRSCREALERGERL